MKKKPKKKPEERTLVLPLVIMMLLSLLQPVLIISRVLPPISSYSIGNVLFSIAWLALIAYLALSRADEGLLKSAMNGAVLGFEGSLITCASALVGTRFYGTPVLGIVADPRQPLILITFIIIESTIALALFSAFVTFIKNTYDKMR